MAKMMPCTLLAFIFNRPTTYKKQRNKTCRAFKSSIDRKALRIAFTSSSPSSSLLPLIHLYGLETKKGEGRELQGMMANCTSRTNERLLMEHQGASRTTLSHAVKKPTAAILNARGGRAHALFSTPIHFYIAPESFFIRAFLLILMLFESARPHVDVENI